MKDNLQVIQYPFFNDNYGYLVIYNGNRDAFIVDPGCAKTAIDIIQQNKCNLKYILNTHHHNDHIGGNIELVNKYHCDVIGYKGDKERINNISIMVDNRDIINFGNHKIEVIFVPGHTIGHIAYYIKDSDILFIGDTLFSGGCGRIFEGTYQQMFDSLNIIKSLPNQTKIYCAHEYTLSNLKFAKTIFPNNINIDNYYSNVLNKRQKKLSTLPSTIAIEKQINPFLLASDLDQFIKFRKLKDNF